MRKKTTSQYRKHKSHKMNRKTLWTDTITKQQIKYSRQRLEQEITTLFYKIIKFENIPQDGKLSIAILIYK